MSTQGVACYSAYSVDYRSVAQTTLAAMQSVQRTPPSCYMQRRFRKVFHESSSHINLLSQGSGCRGGSCSGSRRGGSLEGRRCAGLCGEHCGTGAASLKHCYGVAADCLAVTNTAAAHFFTDVRVTFMPTHVMCCLSMRRMGNGTQVRPGRGQQLLREKAAEIETHLAEIKRLQVWFRMQSFPCAVAPLARYAWVSQLARMPRLTYIGWEFHVLVPAVLVMLCSHHATRDEYMPAASVWQPRFPCACET